MSLHQSKCHIVGNNMSRLNTLLSRKVDGHRSLAFRSACFVFRGSGFIVDTLWVQLLLQFGQSL